MQKILVLVTATALTAAACDDRGPAYTEKLTKLEPAWAVTVDEAYEWALVKDANLSV